MFRKLFPKGIAKGETFFNRTKERDRLVGNIKSCTHTVLIGSRRLGKSSLAKYAIAQSGHLYHELDLFVVTNDNKVGERIIHAASTIIQKLLGSKEKWFRTLRDFFANADKKWTIGFKGIQLELIPDNPKTVAQNILDALEALEFILKQRNKIAIIFIDEFQEILSTESGKAIEGAIRHFAQESEHVVFIFSGSSRTLLKKVFNDRTRPLYSLCDEIQIGRIDASYYHTYLKWASKKTLDTELSNEVIDRILALSDRHPRYVYLLCTELWIRCDGKLPNLDDVDNAWHEYILQKYKDVRIELTGRTSNQIRLLKEIASGNNKNLSGQDSQFAMGLTSSAIVQSLKTLEKLDYIERSLSAEYRIIDPLIKSVLLYAYSREENGPFNCEAQHSSLNHGLGKKSQRVL